MTRKSEAKYLARQTRIAQRTQVARERARLKAALATARRLRAARLSKVRYSVRRGKARLREAIRRFRKEYREYVTQEVRARRARAKAAWQHKVAQAALAPTKRVAAKKRALDEWRAEQKNIAAWSKSARTGPAVRKAFERRSESDQRVRDNLPPELRPVWEKMRTRIKTKSERKTRTEAFLEWAAENPSEVLRLQWGDDDQARLEKELREAEAAAAGVVAAGATPASWEDFPV